MLFDFDTGAGLSWSRLHEIAPFCKGALQRFHKLLQSRTPFINLVMPGYTCGITDLRAD
jgi:hypothetical protein